MPGDLRFRAGHGTLHDRVTTTLANDDATVPDQVLEEGATFHRAAAVCTRIFRSIASTRTAFLSRTCGLGRGRDSPCSSLCSAIRQRASLIIFLACSILLPWEITPGKSSTRTMNQPSSI